MNCWQRFEMMVQMLHLIDMSNVLITLWTFSNEKKWLHCHQMDVILIAHCLYGKHEFGIINWLGSISKIEIFCRRNPIEVHSTKMSRREK